MNMEILFSDDDIKASITQISYEINTTSEYWDDENVFICVLNGGFMFYSDLIRQINMPVYCDFIRIKSYINDQNQTKPIILKDLELNVRNKNVFLVDDILDSGNTMNALVNHCLNKQPLSINVVTLFKRKNTFFENKFGNIHIGSYIQDDIWLYGYGMDNNGLSRNQNKVLFKYI